MPIKYKCDVMQSLRNAGYTRTALRKSKTLPEGTMTKLIAGNVSITVNALPKLCALLNCQPGDLLEYVPDPDDLPNAGTETADE